MLLMFIAIACFIAINLLENERSDFDWELLWGSFVITVVIYGMFGLFMPRLFMLDNDKYSETEYANQPITSLVNKSGSDLSGSFFLGIGSISGGSTDYYVAYAPMEKGDLRVKIDAYKTYVVETDSISPVIKDYWFRKNWKGYKSLWVWNSKPRVREWEKHYGVKSVIVPTNTIYKEFQIRN